MKVQSNYSHTFYGIFWIDLPLALLLSFIFHNIIKADLFRNLPILIQSRILVFNTFQWNNYFKRNWIVVIISILIGIASHIFWDSFTHDHGYFTETISTLKNAVYIFEKEIPVYKIAQHLSTLIGALVILFAISKLPKNDISRNSINKKYWTIVIVLAVTITLIRTYIGLDFKAYGHIIVTAISAFLISLTLTPFIIKLKT